MSDGTYSFEELVHASGVSPRQLRTYFQRGLLPRGSRGGRGARYTREHLDRLGAIAKIREGAPPNTPLEEIRALLDQLDPGTIRAIADGRLPFAVIDDGRPEARVVRLDMPAPGKANEKALEYLEAMQGRPSARSPRRPPDETREVQASFRQLRSARGELDASWSSDAPRAALSLNLRKAAEASAAVPLLRRWLDAMPAPDDEHAPRVRSTEAQTWHRVNAGRDLEIHARGPLREEDVRLLQEAAERLERLLYATAPEPAPLPEDD